MRLTTQIGWIAGMLLVCLGGCPAPTHAPDEAWLRAASGDSADTAGATVQSGGAAAPEESAADVAAGDETAPSGQFGVPGTLPPLGPLPQETTDVGGRDSTGDTGTSDEEPLPEPNTPDDRGVVEAAVDFVMTQFVTAAEVFGTLGELGSPNLDFNPYQTYEWGTCPVARVAVGEEAIGTLISLDFGDGCSAPSTAGEVVVGAGGGLNYVEGEPPAVIFAYLTIDGREVVNQVPYPDDASDDNAIMVGTFTLHDAGLRLEGTCDFAVDGVGGTAGDLAVEFGRNYTQTYPQADLTFTSDSDEQAATLTTVRVSPALYGNFLPDQGTATFTVEASDGAHAVEVQFTTRTPTEGIVTVRVDGGEPFEHVLPPGLL